MKLYTKKETGYVEKSIQKWPWAFKSNSINTLF